MRIIFYSLLGAASLLVAAAAFVLVAAPTGLIRDKMIEAVRAETGRDLLVGGSTSLTLYPNVGVVLEDVSLSNPPGMSEGTFLRTASLEISIPLLPLLRGQVAVDRFVLTNPEILLAVDKSGRKSWTVRADAGEPATGGEAAGPAPAADATSPPKASPGVPSAGLPADLRLGDVRIIDGTLRYQDERSGRSEALTEINVALALSGLSSPLRAEGSLNLRGETVPFKARLDSLAALLAGSTTDATLEVTAKSAVLGFKGAIGLEPGLVLDGRIETEAPSLRRLAKWLGEADLPRGSAYGALELKGSLSLSGGTAELKGLKLALDRSKAAGEIAIETVGKRPHVKADLKVDRLDLAAYLGGGGKAKKEKAKSGATPEAADTAMPSVEGAAVAGEPMLPEDEAAAAKPSRWSRQPFELDGLKSIDADLSLAVGALSYRDLKASAAELVVALKGGLLKARVPKSALYEGRGLGGIALDVRATPPKLEANFTVSGIQTLQLLKDAAGFEWIAGTGELSAGIQGAGRSELEIVRSLVGQGRFEIADGAIVGVDVAKVARGLTEGRFRNFDRVEGEKTDFSELSGTFTMTAGVARNDDLKLLGPLVRMSGGGSVDVPDRSLDYLARPKLVASLEGQGGGDASGLEIPVRIHGGWDDPKLTPDLKGVLKNPGAAVDTVQQLAKKAKGSGKVGETLDKLTSDPGTKKKLKGLLDNVLGAQTSEGEGATGQ